MTLDGHSSREWYEWLELCKHKKCEIVQSPSNTTHFSQPCDQSVNSSFKKGMPRNKYLFHQQTTLAMRSVRLNLMVAVLAYSGITVDKTKSIFEKRVYGNELLISSQFKGKGTHYVHKQSQMQRERIKNVANRTHNSDNRIFRSLLNTFPAATDPSTRLRDVEILLSKT